MFCKIYSILQLITFADETGVLGQIPKHIPDKSLFKFISEPYPGGSPEPELSTFLVAGLGSGVAGG